MFVPENILKVFMFTFEFDKNSYTLNRFFNLKGILTNEYHYVGVNISNNSDNTKWKLNGKTIIHKPTGKCLDVAKKSRIFKSNHYLLLDACNNEPTQNWIRQNV
jgi:hypothetical protein